VGTGAGASSEGLFGFRAICGKLQGSLVGTIVEEIGLCGFHAMFGKVLTSLF
jgi:hypothetical protein